MGKCADGFEGVHGKDDIGKKMQKEEDCWIFVMKKSCTRQILDFIRQKKRKITYSSGGCETDIDFVLVGKNAESM